MKKSNVFLFLSVLLTALFMNSCGGSGGGIISKTPSDVVKAAINALKDKNYDGVVKYYVRKDGAMLTDEEKQKLSGLCTMATKVMEQKKGLKDILILEEKIAQDGQTATVRYKMLYNDGSESEDGSKLKKVNGDWYIIIGN
jgi:hypothetical protein